MHPDNDPSEAPSRSRAARGGGSGGKKVPLRKLLVPSVRALQGYVTQTVVGTSAFHREVAAGINSVPDQIHDFLHHRGHSIVTGDLLVNIEPSLKALQPRGHVGGTWDQLAGAYDPKTKQVWVAESIVQHGLFHKADQVDGILREETGHSLNWALGTSATSMGRLTDQDPQLVKAHEADAQEITDPEHLILFYYFLQPDSDDTGAGRDEAFAYAFSEILGGAVGLPSLRQLFTQKFSRTILEVREHALAS